MITCSQQLIPEKFWEKLPPEELDKTVVQNLPTYVSHDEIVAACECAPNLRVIEHRGLTLVGVVAFGLVMPGREVSPEFFLAAHSDYWAAVPDEGCRIEYVRDETVALPRLVELEEGRESDNQGLLFNIVEALHLNRAAHDSGANAVTYY